MAATSSVPKRARGIDSCGVVASAEQEDLGGRGASDPRGQSAFAAEGQLEDWHSLLAWVQALDSNAGATAQ